MSEPDSIRCEVHYSGRVQGVGFRWNAFYVARGFAVTGFVRNLPDGRVLLVAEGERSEIARLLQAIADSMLGNIEGSRVIFLPATGELTDFTIAR